MHGECGLEKECCHRSVDNDERISFIFDAPQGLNATLLPIYSGMLIIKASDGDVLAVPYQGVGFRIVRGSRERVCGHLPMVACRLPA